MLQQLFKLPRTTDFIVACSGGVDSMAVCDFYRRGGKSFQIAYFNHGTPQADQMESLVAAWALNNQVVMHRGLISSTTKPKGVSPEEYWRNERYAWLNSINDGKPIITCHHLNDAVEGYLFGCLNGTPKVICSTNGYIQRPFLTTTKQDMVDWCVKHSVEWFEDKSNEDISTPRNRIRHNIMKEALLINPGLYKVIRKKVVESYRLIK